MSVEYRIALRSREDDTTWRHGVVGTFTDKAEAIGYAERIARGGDPTRVRVEEREVGEWRPVYGSVNEGES